ncbi:hypothetical protein ANN_05089 [Periplaneta americana]|uniref:Uncharacterized protein n=1 Tax=Periplaneta americana TaxID=6978 RepID=A0ABQ8TBF3_PERAM|nr:hypothetical protein ANN_05089 [Periplaneta americana]
MNERRIPRRALEMKVKGVKILGRPQTRWLDPVQLDLKERDYDWERIQEQELCQDRILWRRLCSGMTYN